MAQDNVNNVLQMRCAVNSYAAEVSNYLTLTTLRHLEYGTTSPRLAGCLIKQEYTRVKILCVPQYKQPYSLRPQTLTSVDQSPHEASRSRSHEYTCRFRAHEETLPPRSQV